MPIPNEYPLDCVGYDFNTSTLPPNGNPPTDPPPLPVNCGIVEFDTILILPPPPPATITREYNEFDPIRISVAPPPPPPDVYPDAKDNPPFPPPLKPPAPGVS